MRGKERRIASSSPQAVLRSKTPESWLASLSLSNSSAEKNPLLLKLTLNHLDYLLVRFEEVGIEQQATGPLDLALDFQPTRPFSAVFVDHDTYTQERKSSFATETMSFFSWMSSTSTNAIGTKTQASLAQDARYCFSCFTKIPSLELSPKSIHFGFVLGFETLPDSTYVPLDAFKNLQMLRLIDVDARVLFGWDRLSTSLKVLEITGNGVDDIQSLLLDRIDADARARQKAFASSYEASSPTESTCRSLSSKWTELRRLNLSSNAITYAPGSECWIHFPTLVHLDLSNNLLVQVPSGERRILLRKSLNTRAD